MIKSMIFFFANKKEYDVFANKKEYDVGHDRMTDKNTCDRLQLVC
jgi:hypothetical protein